MNHEWPPAIHKTMIAIDEVTPETPDLNLVSIRSAPERQGHAFALVAALVVVAVVGGLIYLADRDRDDASSPSTTVEQTTTSLSTAPVTSAGDELATLTIPAINVTATVFEGLSAEVMTKGVGHLADSPEPGQQGNAVLEGHRTVFTHPFFDVDKLQPGDVVIVETTSGRHYEYTVTTTIEFDDYKAAQAALPASGDTPTLALYTCTPAYTANNRLAVYAELNLAASDEPHAASSAAPDSQSPVTGLTC